jgi:hypothetical protein
VLAPKTIRSVNGPAATLIDATRTGRCVFLAHGAMLSGFTLTNGSSGGVYCESSGAVVSNCVISGNSAGDGGGATGGTLYDCSISGNAATPGSGGGANASTLNRCTLSGNSAAFVGGGANNCTLNDCQLIGNRTQDYDGGGAIHCTLNRCSILGNVAYNGGGAAGCTLNNCVVAGNGAVQAGGTLYGGLNNCTVVGNYASYAGSGSWGGVLNNCILYYNSGGNYTWDSGGISLYFCCTTPLPAGPGNITNEPAFVELASGNYHLQTNSPCINSGRNAYATGDLDLDDNPRVAGGTVDIGAYELQSPASVLSYAWAKGCGFPTDGSADYTDPDLDGMNNWQEWIAGTDPTNAASALRLLISEAAPPGVVLRWSSASNHTYSLERATTLNIPVFVVLQTNISGSPGSTAYRDVTAPRQGEAYYRVRADSTNGSPPLVLQAPSFSPPSITLRWASVSNRTYYLQRATNLAGQPLFSVLQTNIPALATNSFTDTTLPASGAAYYRLGVEY